MFAIFRCTKCKTSRVYGNEEPEDHYPLIVCAAERTPTIHEFTRLVERAVWKSPLPRDDKRQMTILRADLGLPPLIEES